MRQYAKPRILKDILLIAENKGFDIDSREFDRGSDFIWLRDRCARNVLIAVNPHNGQFFAWVPGKEEAWATERSVDLNDNPLYKEIVEMIYQLTI